jgi:hypothetical protein
VLFAIAVGEKAHDRGIVVDGPRHEDPCGGLAPAAQALLAAQRVDGRVDALERAVGVVAVGHAAGELRTEAADVLRDEELADPRETGLPNQFASATTERT